MAVAVVLVFLLVGCVLSRPSGDLPGDLPGGLPGGLLEGPYVPIYALCAAVVGAGLGLAGWFIFLGTDQYAPLEATARRSARSLSATLPEADPHTLNFLPPPWPPASQARASALLLERAGEWETAPMVLRLEQGSLVTVFGGSGFLGRHAVRALAREGWRVRAAMRRPDLAGHLQPMGHVGQVHAVQANVRHPSSVQRALEGARAVVNLVGILETSGAQTFEAVHVAGARAVAKAAKEAGAEHLVHVSAIGAHKQSRSKYGRSKWSGEVAALEQFPGAVVLRPAPIFGPEDRLFNRCAEVARFLPLLPLLGGGKTRVQPVYVGDVAAAIVAACGGAPQRGAIYELGGPEVITWRGLFDRAQGWSGRKRPYLPVPFTLAKLGALLSLPLPHAWRPLGLDEIRMLQGPNVVSKEADADARTLAGLGQSAHAMEGIVPTYLQRFQRHGQFAHYRG